MSTRNANASDGPAITLLFDGACELCVREMSFIVKRDRRRHPEHQRIALVNIAEPDFDASAYGLTREQAMGGMHGVLPDGRVVVGMEVFRRAYKAVGLGWLIAPTGWPVLKPIFDALYRWFARNRVRISSAFGKCVGGQCKVPTAPPKRAADAA